MIAPSPNLPPVLLTGATGVLGSRLLLELIRVQRRKVFCLIRAQSVEHARQRLRQAVAIYAYKTPLENDEIARIIPIVGDLTSPDLGMEPRLYRQILTSVAQVINVAANVNLAGMYPDLEKINVSGVRRIVAFCQKAQVPLLHTSSYSVAGMKAFDANVTFHETDYDIGQTFDLYFYPRSKFEGERVVRDAGANGLNFTIARPGNIFGDSETGAYPLQGTTISGIYYSILKTVADTGVTLFSDAWADVTPVDYVAKALAIMSREPFSNQTYHLLNPDRKSFFHLTNNVVDCGYRIKTFPIREFFEIFKAGRLRINGIPYTSEFANMGAVFRSYFETMQMTALYATRQTEEFLGGHSLVCARNDKDLMATYLNYCIEQNYLQGPNPNTTVEIQ